MGSMSFISVLVLLLSGGGNDLLDYAHTAAYWKSKGVVVSVDQLLGELVIPEGQDVTKLIRELGAEDPAARDAATQNILKIGPSVTPQLQQAAKGANREIATRAQSLVEQLNAAGKAAGVRRLMAIRTLGEMKKPEAVEKLKGLLASKELFVAEYAAQAIASIEGKPLSRRGITAANRSDDLSLLPAKVDVVAQYVFGNGGASNIEQLLNGINPRTGEKNDEFISSVAGVIITAAERVGNLRLESVTAGIFSNAPNAPGFGIVVVRGSWDTEALVAAAQDPETLGATVETIAGLTVLRKEKNAAMIVASGERLVLIFSDGGGVIPLPVMIAAIKKGAGDFNTNAAMTKLLAGVDQKADVWVAAIVTDGLRQVMEPLRPLDTFSLTVERAGDSLDFKCAGQGKDADAVKQMTDEMLKQLNQTATMLAGAAPQLQPFAEFLKSIHFATEDGKVLGGGTLKGGLKILPALFLGASLDAPSKQDVLPQPEVVKPDAR